MNLRYLTILILIYYKTYNNKLALFNNRNKCEYNLLYYLLYLFNYIYI